MDLSSYLEEVDYASPCKEYNISKKKQVGNWDIILPLTKLSKLFDLNLIWKVELQKVHWNVSIKQSCRGQLGFDLKDSFGPIYLIEINFFF